MTTNGLPSSGASSMYDLSSKTKTARPLVPSYVGSVAFSGELYKLSNRKLLASWKPRFFVLDTEHHQIRYYDTAEDEVARGYIDLQDVRGVRLLSNNSSVPRRFQDNCAFEVGPHKPCDFS